MLRGAPYFFVIRLRSFSAAALSRLAVTTASKTSPSWSTARQTGEWRGGVSPPRSLRTGRDTLASSGSPCSAASMDQAPVSEKPRLLARDAQQPVSGSSLVPAHGLKLSGRPSRQNPVDVQQGWIEGRRTKPTVVVDPAPDVRVEHPRQILKGLVAAPVQRPAPDGPSDRLERSWAGRGAERDAHSPVSFAHHPRPEHVAEKVEP